MYTFFIDRIRITTRSHNPSWYAPGHVERFRGRYWVRPVPMRVANSQRSSDALDRAHVCRLQGIHVLSVFSYIHCAHRFAGTHDRRSFGRDATIRLSQIQLSGQVLFHCRTWSSHTGTPRTGRARKRKKMIDCWCVMKHRCLKCKKLIWDLYYINY